MAWRAPWAQRTLPRRDGHSVPAYTSLSVKEANIEPIGKYPKKRLATRFAESALAYTYYDPGKNDHVFERSYALAASEGQDGVAKFFLDMFEHESLFDAVYDQMAQ